ncbi:PAS domain S-box protein [Mucilaginibacter sp. RB4R14]|uniref:PAS domain S-box protein n=1 Tax=Mucilaginibacter aurantiaciroseus TaxID=2949308 RepID=UPI002090D85E|nr:PAS domain S-box protein [Mucilaginibacter aurantiaciroseus]MCO5937101.1 PAS domain S-box protein [Mucilaginibacter aurantiaciroseus]
MSSYPKPSNELERLKALDDYDILDSLSENEFDRLTELAVIICDVPISIVSLIDEHRQWFKSVIGFDAKEVPREIAFCRHTIADARYIEVKDATKDIRFMYNPMVTSSPNLRFYAGFPLIDPDGCALGTICVADSTPRTLSVYQKRALQLLADEAITLIVERRKKQDLKNFEKLFQTSNDLVFVGGVDGLFKRVNPAFTKVLGWSERHMLTTSSFDLIHPDDIIKTEAQLKNMLNGGDTTNFLQRMKTINGNYKTIEWTSTPEILTGNIFGIGRDVSAIVLKDKLLAESEEKLRVFFENAQGLMCTHDVNGKFLSVNSAGAGSLGYAPDEIVQLSLFDIVPEKIHGFLRTYLEEITSKGKSQGQMLTRHKNGSLKVWLYNNTLQTPPRGGTYVIGNAIDITERYLLEKDLERTTEMLEQTNQVARVGGWELDVIQQKVYWTPVTKQIHGVSADYEPSLNIGINFYKEGDSRDRITKAINKAIADGASWNEELQIINAEGKEIWVRALGNTEFKDGACTRLYGTFQDISGSKSAELALKRSIETQEALNLALMKQVALVKEQDKTIEKIQEFKFLADSIPQIIWTSNPDGTMDYYNKHWFDYTGLSPEDTLYYGWEPVIHPEDAPKDYADWHHSLATGKPYRSELRFRRAVDGVYKWHKAMAQPMLAADGSILKWFGSCYDIDEYKRALDLENRISQYEDFNRIVAHNLRGPSGSIRMILTMINDASDEQEKAELFRMLNQSSETLNETLNELMRVLEVRNSKNIAYDTCDLQEMTKVTAAMLKGQMMEKKAKITTDFGVTSLQFPKMYLESIFYNMVSNSLKYSKTGVPPVINIVSALINAHVTLTFSDNGLGIDLKRHGKDMFKLNSVFHAGHDSKGIGLFMTKTQIETFGGKISVESEPNIGTKFTIVF